MHLAGQSKFYFWLKKPKWNNCQYKYHFEFFLGLECRKILMQLDLRDIQSLSKTHSMNNFSTCTVQFKSELLLNPRTICTHWIIVVSVGLFLFYFACFCTVECNSKGCCQFFPLLLFKLYPGPHTKSYFLEK